MENRRNALKSVLSLVLALLLAVTPLVPLAAATGDASAAATHTLIASELEKFGENTKQDGDATKVDDFFTLLWSAKSRVEESGEKTFADDYVSKGRINFGGKAEETKNAVKFTTDGKATVKIWWVQSGDDNREMAVKTVKDGALVNAAATSGTYEKNKAYISELTLDEAGTYYLGGDAKNNYIFKVEVTTGAVEKPPRADWSTVASPAITGVTQDGGSVNVTVSAAVGYDAADQVKVTMSLDGAVKDTKSSSAEKAEYAFTFTPSASGTYTFTAVIARDGENDKTSGAETFSFVLPLAKPAFKGAYNGGGGTVNLEWEPVDEATGYEVNIKDTETKNTATECETSFTGLTVGNTYTFVLTALRGTEHSESTEISCTVTEEAETAWAFSAFGTGVTLSANGYTGSAKDGAVTVYSTGGKGKLVPASTDGLAFYYTKIDPSTQNFKLKATANVKSWTYSNGQEGFGLMAADSVGKNGDSTTFWNNSYLAAVTKVEYLWDGEKVSDSGAKISMKLGVGSQEKIGVTADNINEARQLDDMSVYSSKMTTLESSCASSAGGTFNLVGNFTNNPGPDGTVANPLTKFELTLEKNNTGYFVSYTDEKGETHTNKYYDTEALSHLENDAVYVGFFASRNATIEFTDIEFTTSDPRTDAPAEERPMTYVQPAYTVESATIANSADYTLVYYGNADGIIWIQDGEGSTVTNANVTANTKLRVPVKLEKGSNTFTVTVTPDPEYKPSEYEALSTYDPAVITHTVRYEVNDAEIVYVSPDGKADAPGTRDEPTSIYSAVNKAVPGQTIYLMEGTYNMTSKLVIERGINGTAEKNISLFADPESYTRPVIDFGLNYSGVVLAANYWHLKGFDVTRTKNGEKGIQVAGNNNTLELLETYRNGNTGVQISRYKGTDEFDEWPSDNLILNCTSTLNADRGYEDADGFAAKLTIGNGNVFDGCISAYNADDGWDLYAKIENGPIGKVIIKNSVAYKNGYILDENGNEVNAGNGNGFKMGGESITGYHTLINSVAFANKSKGIDSNSCPDIQVESSTSFDNEANNVAFYTNTAVNTDYSAQGVLSYKKSNTVGENIKPVGKQDRDKIYGVTNFYYDGGAFKNTEGKEVQDNWFVSLDVEKAIGGGITRYADGTINMNGFLQLTDKAPEGVGARLEHPFGKGDVSRDHELTNVDLVMIARYIVHLTAFDDEQLALADINGDGAVTNADLVLTARTIVTSKVK